MNRLEAWQQDGREVSVAGLGRSGLAAARLLHAHGIKVYVSDRGTGDRVLEAVLALRGVSREAFGIDAGSHDHARIARSAALILSPGIPPDAAVVLAAQDAGVPVIAEAQLGLDAMPEVPVIGITGTNGKTTTTALIDHILRASGLRSVAAGNIGRPLCAVAMETPLPEWLVVELSSFQLHDMPGVTPRIGVLTNLSPDHLDRYATLETYYADKARLFANATERSVWVSNQDDHASREMLRAVPGTHRRFTVAPGTRADGWYDRETDHLVIGGQTLMRRRAMPLPGDHNIANALAAALAAREAGVDLPAIAAALSTFHGLPHRLELIREVDGVSWINDSKATNIGSTRVALQAMTRPYVLLLGGRHKGESYTGLIGPLSHHGVAVVAYGEAGDLIEEDLSPALRVVRAGSFEEVLAKGRILAPAGGSVLLSPACSSYDMFDNYEQRGAEFRRLVEEM